MAKFFKFKKITRIFGKNSKIEAERRINPKRDWKIILTVFSVINLSLIIFSAYVYWKINTGDFLVLPDKQESMVETIDRSELKKIIDIYAAKERLFSELKSKKPTVIDPSI